MSGTAAIKATLRALFCSMLVLFCLAISGCAGSSNPPASVSSDPGRDVTVDLRVTNKSGKTFTTPPELANLDFDVEKLLSLWPPEQLQQSERATLQVTVITAAKGKIILSPVKLNGMDLPAGNDSVAIAVLSGNYLTMNGTKPAVVCKRKTPKGLDLYIFFIKAKDAGSIRV